MPAPTRATTALGGVEVNWGRVVDQLYTWPHDPDLEDDWSKMLTRCRQCRSFRWYETNCKPAYAPGWGWENQCSDCARKEFQ
jgi:hypothetical protein